MYLFYMDSGKSLSIMLRWKIHYLSHITREMSNWIVNINFFYYPIQSLYIFFLRTYIQFIIITQERVNLLITWEVLIIICCCFYFPYWKLQSVRKVYASALPVHIQTWKRSLLDIFSSSFEIKLNKWRVFPISSFEGKKSIK